MKIFKLIRYVVIVTLLCSGALFAHDDTRELDVVIEDILSEQNVTALSEVDPEALSTNLVKELGDAVMMEIHPDDEVHDFMDSMMGGAFSDDLGYAHMIMGYRYINSFNEDYDYRYEMMGPGMMYYGYGPGMMGDWDDNENNNWNDNYPMHGYWWGENGAVINWLWVLFVVIVVIILIIAIYFLFRKKGGVKSDDYRDILKSRYARGEITKEQFEKMKRDIES